MLRCKRTVGLELGVIGVVGVGVGGDGVGRGGGVGGRYGDGTATAGWAAARRRQIRRRQAAVLYLVFAFVPYHPEQLISCYLPRRCDRIETGLQQYTTPATRGKRDDFPNTRVSERF